MLLHNGYWTYLFIHPFQSIVLWSCRQVTGNGLLFLVNKCGKLESINVWGTRLPVDCFIGLLTISPALQIKPEGLVLNVGVASMLPVAWGANSRLPFFCSLYKLFVSCCIFIFIIKYIIWMKKLMVSTLACTVAQQLYSFVLLLPKYIKIEE